jgi:hypothetical protein
MAMKLILILLMILISISSNAFAIEMNLGACQATANEFILKGDQTTSHPGARLWNFKKFSSRFQDHQGSECEREAFDQALKEAKEYWDHIKEKYHCPKEGMKVCESALMNENYISGMADIYNGSIVISDKENEKILAKNPKCVIYPPAHQKVKDLHKDVFKILTYMPDINAPVDACAHIAPKDRKSATANSSQASIVGSAIGGCMIGIIKGIFSNIKDLVTGLWDLLKMGYELAKKFGSTIIDFLKAAWYGTTATFFAEQAAQGQDFFKKLVDGFKSIPNAIYSAVSSGVADFQCLNGPAQTAAICKGVGYVGSEIFIGILTGGIGIEAKLAAKAADAAKLVSKSSEVARVVKTEKKVVEGIKVVEAGTKANKAASKIDELRSVFKNLVTEIDPKFKYPSDYFKGIKNIDAQQARKYMMDMGAKEADLKPGSRWSKVMGSKLHPDRFARHNNPEIEMMAHKESLNFQGIFEMAVNP